MQELQKKIKNETYVLERLRLYFFIILTLIFDKCRIKVLWGKSTIIEKQPSYIQPNSA